MDPRSAHDNPFDVLEEEPERRRRPRVLLSVLVALASGAVLVAILGVRPPVSSRVPPPGPSAPAPALTSVTGQIVEVPRERPGAGARVRAGDRQGGDDAGGGVDIRPLEPG